MQQLPTNLMALDRLAMDAFFADIGEKKFRSQQVLQWLYQRKVTDIGQMTDLSKTLRQKLSNTTSLVLPEIVNLNCTFCATARQGYSRNLSVDEIIGQVWIANDTLEQMGHTLQKPGDQSDQRRPVTNVVMMGMGEPLANFNNVVSAMNLMMDDFTFGLSRRRVTLSTAGMVPAIDRLAATCPVSLAVSLHAPNDALRDQIVPLNRKYPINVLLDACRRYVGDSGRQRVTFEYVMLDGINDSPEHAKQLAEILDDMPAKVNLIPFNPFEGIPYRRSSNNAINRFRDALLSRNIFTVTRKTRGDDIDAACGQLAGEFIDRTRRSERMKQSSVKVAMS